MHEPVTPVTTPPEDTVIHGLPVDHVPPPMAPVSVILAPAQTVVGPVMTAVGAGLTVIVCTAVEVPQRLVRV